LRVLQALEWAIRQGVDVISLSWTTGSISSELHEAIERAAKGRLLFCSSADKGVRGDNTITEYLKDKVIRVSAAGPDHLPRKLSDKSVDFMVDGEDIAADGPRYMTAHYKESVSGSSVATALASGIASLVLSVARIANDKGGPADKFRTRDGMLKVFEDMVHKNDTHRVIDPSLIFNSKKGFAFSRESATPPPSLQNFRWEAYQERELKWTNPMSPDLSEDESQENKSEEDNPSQELEDNPGQGIEEEEWGEYAVGGAKEDE
jgi:hypothetical protein